MHGKPATQNEQFKYNDVLYYKYLHVLSKKLHKTSPNHQLVTASTGVVCWE